MAPAGQGRLFRQVAGGSTRAPGAVRAGLPALLAGRAPAPPGAPVDERRPAGPPVTEAPVFLFLGRLPLWSSSRVVLTSSHVPEFRKAFPQPPEHLGGEEPCPACSLPKGQDSQPRRSPSGAKRATLKNENVSVQRGTGLPMGTPSTNESPPPLPSRAGFSERIEGCEAGQGPFPLFCTCRGS
uniref:Uncharacterized protein n=1 Tax=Rangifer tarandus platyrhynchus TaxID=3082113 RepID=A0ACB0FDX0_RANTA|nr:unnamed protein product [Rangifer tarandus platyrhynchus]